MLVICKSKMAWQTMLVLTLLESKTNLNSLWKLNWFDVTNLFVNREEIIFKLPYIRDIYQSPLTGYAYVTPSKIGHRLSSLSRRSAEGFTTCVRALASTWNNCWSRWMSDWLIHLIRVPPQWGTFLNLVAVGKAAFSHKFSGALTIKQAATNVYVFASSWWNIGTLLAHAKCTSWIEFSGFIFWLESPRVSLCHAWGTEYNVSSSEWHGPSPRTCSEPVRLNM